MDLLGLKELEPKLAAAMQSVVNQLETQTKETAQALLTQVQGIADSTLKQINGAQVIAVITIKLPEDDAKMAAIPK